MQFMTKPPGGGPAFTVAQVTYSDSGGFGALGESEIRAAPIFGPRGIQWTPCEGDNVLLVRENGADICLGVLSTAGLAPGELRAVTPGGAVLHLKNNGEIRLNDLVIPPVGQGGTLQWIL
jgi:hypothetical protein